MTKKYIEAPSNTGHKTFSGYGIFIADLGDGDELFYHSGSAVAIRSEAGYIPQKNLYFAILSNVMFKLSQSSEIEIDSKKPENQLDILYFREAVLKAVK